MPDIPLQSNFGSHAGDGAEDSSATLFLGMQVISTSLAEELSDSEDEVLYVVDATGAPMKGYAVCEDELIYFQSRLNKDQIKALSRGQQDTAAVVHAIGTPITLHPLYYIPQSVQDAIINLQKRVIALGG